MTACPLTRSTNATSATRRSWARHVGATPASSRRSCPLHGWLFVCLVQSRASAIAVHLHALLSSPSSQLEAAMKQQQQRQQQQRRGIWRASPAATPLRCPALPTRLPACLPARPAEAHHLFPPGAQPVRVPGAHGARGGVADLPPRRYQGGWVGRWVQGCQGPVPVEGAGLKEGRGSGVEENSGRGTAVAGDVLAPAFLNKPFNFLPCPATSPCSPAACA